MPRSPLAAPEAGSSIVGAAPMPGAVPERAILPVLTDGSGSGAPSCYQGGRQ